MHDKELQEIAGKVGWRLVQNNQLVALAESCTGGWIGQALTAVPGSSRFFERGYISYSNLAKTQMLGVDPSLIEEHGAVSGPVVEAMASGALAASAADWSIAVSGVAGPDGGSAERPVGTVWIAWAGPDRKAESQRFLFEGDRVAVRRASVISGLLGLLDRLE